MRILTALKNLIRAPQVLVEIRDGIANQHDALNARLEEIRDGLAAQYRDGGGALPDPAVVAWGRELQDFAPSRFDTIPPFPTVDLDKQPIQDILAFPAFQQCVDVLAASGRPDESLMSCHSQALLYCLIRNVLPVSVVEIGTYRAGTAEAICRALEANRKGVLHTVDPFGAGVVPPIIRSWPREHQARVRFHPVSSMDFFARMVEGAGTAEIMLVDGNHDYEFALFDIEAAARVLKPGGFLFVDNINQAGPYLAAQDFLSRHGGWTDCGDSLRHEILARPFDGHRATIPNTDFCVLRAPQHLTLTSRPYSPGQIKWPARDFSGIRLQAQGEPGRLFCQCVVRTFASTSVLGEQAVDTSAEVTPGGETRISFDSPPRIDASVVHVTVEPWLGWKGPSPLRVMSWGLF